MRLRGVDIRRMPGLERPLRVAFDDAPLVVVLGPNASGKSTLCAAIRAALWPQPGNARLDAAEIVTEWSDGGAARRAVFDRGRVEWQRDGLEAAPPPLPDPRFEGCFTIGLADLLDPEGATDAGLAARLAALLAGGYDLPGLLAARELKVTRGRPEARALRDARQRLGEARAAAADLAGDEERLATLRDERSAAEEAERRRDLLARAVERARLLGELASKAAAVAALAEDELAAARQAVGGRTLLEDAVLDGWIGRARELAALEREIAADEARLAETRAREVEAGRGLVVDDALVRAVDAAALAEIEDLLRRVARSDALRGALEREFPAPPEGAGDPEALNAATGLLRRWLGARAVSTPPLSTPAAWIATLGALAVGLAFGFFVHPWLAFVSGVALAGLVLWLARSRRLVHPERAGLEQEYRALRLPATPLWNEEAVLAALYRHESDLARAAEAAALAEQRARLLHETARAAGALAALQADVAALARRFGLDPGLALLPLHEFAARWRVRCEAHAVAVGVEASLAARCAQRDRERDEIARFLAAHGRAADHPAAELDALKTDNARLAATLERLTVLERVRDTAGRLLERARSRGAMPVEGSAPRAGLPPGRERDQLLADAAALDAQIGSIEQALGADRELLGLDEATLRERSAQAEAAAGARDELIAEIARLELQLATAANSTAIEQALADEADAAAALAAVRDEAVRTAIARLVVESVRDRHERESRPPVLDRAARWFERFTGHACELRFDDRAPAFRALDTATGAGRSLAELSDGTRVQLLLAARLAFVAETERGTPLPLFLDEVLSNSDALRSRAVVAALLELVRGGERQVIYLTCSPADVALLREACRDAGLPAPTEIDLAALRDATPTPGIFAAPGLPDVPAPGDADPEGYAVRLGVPAPRAADPVSALHVFFALRDDLPLLHRVLAELRIERIGRLAAALRSGAVRAALGPELESRLAARVALVEAVHEAWSIGRGRPVDRAALEPVVTDTFLDRLTALAGEQGGDARLLLAALDERSDPRTKGFRGANLAALRQHLEEGGWLDPREPLEDGALRDRVLIRVAGLLEDGALSVRDVQRAVTELSGALAGFRHVRER